MKQKLLNKLWLRVGMIVAIMTTALSGTAWADTNVTYDFSQIEGFSNWGSSYTSHVVNYDEATVTFASANKNGQTITDIPVTKGGEVSLVLNNANYVLKSATFTCRQWTTKAQTITLHYSTNGGTTYTSTGETSSNFTISSNSLPDGTNAIKITFSSTSNQVGIASASITYAPNASSAVATTTTIDASGITNTDVYTSTEAGSLSATVKDNNNATITGATVTWSSSDEDVATIAADGTVTLVAAGTTTITARYAGVANQYMSSNATYELTVTDSTPFTGGDVTFDATKDKGNTAAGAGSIEKDGVTFSCNNGILGNGTEYRLYKNSVTTFSVSEGTITQIAFTCKSGNPASGFASQTGWTTDGYNGTWTGNAQSVTFTASEKQVQATQIVVTVDLSATPDPVINADNVNIAYNAEDGEIAYTISNPVSGGSLVASETASWLEVDDVAQGTPTGTIEFICDTNPTGTQRTAEVTLTYTYNTNETLTKTVVITQAGNPDALVTIAEARAQGTGNVHTKGIVTSSVGTTAYIQDANAAICVYGESLTVGDEIEVNGTLTDFHGLLEITSPTISVLTQNNTVTPEVMTIAQVIASTKQGWFVKIEDATVKVIDSSNSHNNTIAQGENTITLHGNLGNVEENDIITFNGNIGCYTNVQLVNPTDVTVTGTVTPTTYTLSWTAGEHTELFVFNAADTANPLTSGDDIAPGTTIQVSVDVASGYELESLVVDGNDVTDQIDATGVYEFVMPSHNVAITSSATASSVTPTSTASVTFDFSDTGWGFPENYTATEGLYTNGGYTITLSEVTSGGHKALMSSGQNPVQVGLIFGKTGASLALPAFSFNVKKIIVYGNSGASTTVTENIFVGDEAVSTEVTSAATDHEFVIDENYQEAGNVYILKLTNTNKNSQVTKIEVFGYESVTVTDAGYATFASDNALDFTGSSIKAFYATESAAGTLSFTQVNKVPADTGVLLYADGGATVDVPVFTGAAAELTGNVFVRGTGAKVSYDANDQNYILFNGADGIGFYRANNNTVATNRAYIHVNGNGVKGFVINLEDDATGISLMEDGRSQMEDGVIYNVAGQRISKMQKGINIVNGKKILK